MRGIDILASYELEIAKLDDTLEKPATDDSLYWINQAAIKFTKDRFNGNAPKRTSYEQNEKRSRDLIGLFRETVYTPEDTYQVSNVVRPSVITVEHVDLHPAEDKGFVFDTDLKRSVKQAKLQYTGNTDVFKYVVLDKQEKAEPIPQAAFMEGTFADIENVAKNIADGDSIVAVPKNEEITGRRVLLSYKNSTIKKDTSHIDYDQYTITYPQSDSLMFVLNEDVVISDLEGNHKMDTCVFECTADSFMYRVNNSLTDFHYRHHRARPLRVRTADGCRLLTDKKYKINSYTLGYLKVPEEITSDDPFKEYTDFEDYTWLEIVKIAAQMYIENQSDPRYKTITNEVLTQE